MSHIVKKVIVVVVLSFYVFSLYSMNTDGSLRGDVVYYISGDMISSVATSGLDMLCSSFNSVVTTTINASSDNAAFAKLGWPPVGDVNKAELVKGLAVQERHSNNILNNVINSRIRKLK